MANFQIHELTSGTIDRDSNVIHDTLNGLDYETRKATAGAVADLNNIQIANEYDDTSTYSYGDYTIKDGVLYRNIVAITSPEAWTSAHWTAVMVTGEYKRVRIMTKAQFDLLSNDEKDGFIYVSDYPTKIQDIDNVTLTTSDNNKLLGVSVSGSDISVEAVALYEEGSSGNFKYRKWSDGTLEMWGYKEDTDTVTLATWGSWYGCDFNGLGQYPIAFTSIHYINGNVVVDGYNGISSIVYPTTLTNAPAYIWDRGNTIASGTRRYRRYLYVKGTWN